MHRRATCAMRAFGRASRNDASMTTSVLVLASVCDGLQSSSQCGNVVPRSEWWQSPMVIEVIEWYFVALMALVAIYAIEFAVSRLGAWWRGEGVRGAHEPDADQDGCKQAA